MVVSLEDGFPTKYFSSGVFSDNKGVLPWTEMPRVLHLLAVLSLELTLFLILPQILEIMTASKYLAYSFKFCLHN